MHTNRREFVIGAGGALAVKRAAGSVPSIKAVAFDAFPILDARPVFALTEELFPGKGTELSGFWRTRQFEYTWLRTMSRSYSDFWSVTEDALVFAAKTLKLELTREKRTRLMEAYLGLRCWPDVPAALRTLKNAHIRIAFLSNMTTQMLEAGIHNSGLEGLFDHVLSTDRVKAYKPDPRAYQMGLDAFRLKRSEVVFAAFAGWDAAGAKAFGYPTFWVNRQNQPSEELGAAPDGEGSSLKDLAEFVTR
jgi:2-haloacid dehalogenase